VSSFLTAYQHILAYLVPIAQRSDVGVVSGVCLFVSLSVRAITSERLNVGRWNLAVRCVTKISPFEFEGQGQRSKIKVIEDRKTKKTADSSRL